MKALFIVDAVNLLFRSYYAIGAMQNSKGEQTNALFGFIRSLNKLIESVQAISLIAVFDGENNKERRSALYPLYKSHRTKMPEELFSQLKQAIHWCDLAGIPHLSIPGVEADDTMGSITTWAEKQGTTVYLCSSDKDLCQLINDRVFMIQIHKKNRLLDKKGVEDLYGVSPSQMVDFLAIVGDPSDNIPGLQGFGPKTAAALLQKFKTLENILNNTEKIDGGKKQKTIEQEKETALLSQKLARIDTTLQFPKETTFFKIQPPKKNLLIDFYQAMGFFSLLQEIAPKPLDTYDYITVDDLNTLHLTIQQLQEAKEICLDTETTNLKPLLASMVGISFSINTKKCWYIPLNGRVSKDTILQQIKKLLSHPEVTVFGHNIKYDIHVLCNEGIKPPTVSFDTILASYILSPENPKHGLDFLAMQYLHHKKIPITDLIGKGNKQISMEQLPISSIAPYSCEDVECTSKLKTIFEKELQKKNLLTLFHKVEMPLLPILTAMERRGIYLDPFILKEISKELTTEISKVETEIFQLCGETFNIKSPKQLSDILFTKMKLPRYKKNNTSTSAHILEELENEFPIAKKILTYRTLEKLRSTYVDALVEEINPTTKRIHCSFNQSVTATGRLSCQNPNLQNIPVKTPIGKKIRTAFKPQNPHWSFLSADYSQIELRLLAHLSEDPALMKAFNEGEDVHAYTASLIFNTPLKDVTPTMRHKAKTVNFGLIYGQQAFGLSQILKIDLKEASDFIEKYFQRYAKVRDYFEFCKETARTTGFSSTMEGRVRGITNIRSNNPMLRAAAERLAINTPLQGSAADLIKIAMIEINKALQSNNFSCYMLLQIHDELVFECPDDHLQKLKHQVQILMEGVAKLKIPLEVNISIGKNWGEC
jgi:DNA polymerase I